VTAINFLNNPKVSRSTLIQKRNFLASKGLTDAEIQRAFEKVGIFVTTSDMNNNENETRINIPQPTATAPVRYSHAMTTFEKIKDIVSSAALISGIAYGIYMFYKVKKRLRPTFDLLYEQMKKLLFLLTAIY
jgi:peroxin-14